MISVPPILVVIYLIAYALAGMILGGLTGLVASVIWKLPKRGVFVDAILGSAGFLAGFFACIFLPWPRNTVTSVKDGVTMSLTMNRYQHPVAAALVVAVLFPLLHELYRLRRSRARRL